MKLKKLLSAAGLTLALTAGAVGAGSASAQPAALWSLHTDMTKPLHAVGTSCTLAEHQAYALARTKWGTVIGCGAYFQHNVLVAHWTYLWFKNDGSFDVWATDGWLYPHGSRPAVYTGTRPTT
jgi:hypothetical protein